MRSPKPKLEQVLFWVGPIVILCILALDIALALHKPLWQDEGYEIAFSCARPAYEMITRGVITQCSPSPLYYLLQKAWIFAWGGSASGLLWKYRVISLASAALTLAFSFGFMLRGFGLVSALVTVLLLDNQRLFHLYAAENRPYMLWVLLFSVAVLLAGLPKSSKKLLFPVSLLLSCVSGAGGIQSSASLVGRIFNNDGIRKYVPLIFSNLVVGYFYARYSCNDYSAAQYDLLKTKDWGLFKDVFFLLFPLGSPITWVLNGCLFLGLFFPLLPLRFHPKAPQFRSFHRQLALQLAAGLLIGVLVVQRHYYFVARVFLFLIVLRAFLIALGVAVLNHWVCKFRPKWRQFVLIGTALLLVLSFTKVALSRRSEMGMKPNRFVKNVPQSEVDCHLLAEHMIPTIAPGGDPSDRYNFVIEMERTLNACSQKPGTGVYADLDPSTTLGYSILNQLPTGHEVISQCGQEIKFK